MAAKKTEYTTFFGKKKKCCANCISFYGETKDTEKQYCDELGKYVGGKFSCSRYMERN